MLGTQSSSGPARAIGPSSMRSGSYTTSGTRQGSCSILWTVTAGRDGPSLSCFARLRLSGAPGLNGASTDTGEVGLGINCSGKCLLALRLADSLILSRDGNWSSSIERASRIFRTESSQAPINADREQISPHWSLPLTSLSSKHNMEDECPDPTLKSLLQDQYRWIFVGGKVCSPARAAQCTPPPSPPAAALLRPGSNPPPAHLPAQLLRSMLAAQ